MMPSSYLILWWSLLLPSIFPSIRDFSNESALCIRWLIYCSFSFSINPSNEYSRLISLEIDSVFCAVLSHSIMSKSLWPMNSSLPDSAVHGDSPGRYTGVGCHALLQGGLPYPGTKPRSSALQENSLPSEPQGKLENTGVGSLSLL